MNTTFKVKGLGGKRELEGSVSVKGAKNAALKVMASSLLFSDTLHMKNVPEIEDVERVGELLRALGCRVETPIKNERALNTNDLKSSILSPEISGRMRGSIVFTGPLLARTGEVRFPNPGGCNLGARPIDLFLEGFEALGARVSEEDGQYIVRAEDGKLMGAEFFFRVQSHTGTETMMMAATLAEGTTVLKNCALEPEVKSLADYLNTCGAQIEGAGTPTITIKGGGLLVANGVIYATIPDRIETVSFMVLGALACKSLTITDCNPEHFEIATAIMRRAGVPIKTTENSVTISAPEKLSAVNVRTHEYPGLGTDVQPQMGLFLTQCSGESAIFETIFENRLGYLKDLERMGADVAIEDLHRAIITGPTKLQATELRAPDLRAGLTFLMAGLIAEGESTVTNGYMIDRGYEDIEGRLAGLGATIQRIETKQNSA